MTQILAYLGSLLNVITVACRVPINIPLFSHFLDVRQSDVVLSDVLSCRREEWEEGEMRCAHSCVERAIKRVYHTRTLYKEERLVRGGASKKNAHTQSVPCTA
jgi:hypothetical protein